MSIKNEKKLEKSAFYFNFCIQLLQIFLLLKNFKSELELQKTQYGVSFFIHIPLSSKYIPKESFSFMSNIFRISIGITILPNSSIFLIKYDLLKINPPLLFMYKKIYFENNNLHQLDVIVHIKLLYHYLRGVKMGARKLNDNLNIIAKNLRKYREEKKLSQPDICRELALMGITMYNNDIYKIEHNKRTVKDYELYAFCKVLEISYEQLFKGAEDIFKF